MYKPIITLKIQKLKYQRIISLLDDIDELSQPRYYETMADASIAHKKISERCDIIHDLLIGAVTYMEGSDA